MLCSGQAAPTHVAYLEKFQICEAAHFLNVWCASVCVCVCVCVCV